MGRDDQRGGRHMHGGECRDSRYTRRRERCGSRAEGACSRSHGFRLCCGDCGDGYVQLVMSSHVIYLDREIRSEEANEALSEDTKAKVRRSVKSRKKSEGMP